MAGITIGGRRWKLVYAPIRINDGDCDPPGVKGKTIRIARSLKNSPKALLETLIHEALHAADITRNEEWVTQIAADISRLLWREGFRRK